MEREAIILESKTLTEETVRKNNILEVSKTKDISGINFSMGNNVQTRVASAQTSPFFKTIPEGDMDAQITGGTYKNIANIT